jgi:hypothetical protein
MLHYHVIVCPCPPHLGPGGHTRFRGRGGDQIQTTLQKRRYSIQYNNFCTPTVYKKEETWVHPLPYRELGVHSMESAEDVHNKGKGNKFS